MGAIAEEGLQTYSVAVFGGAQKQSQGTLQVKSWSAAERNRRSLRALALCWGAALLTLLIPLVHFVLPPLLFVVGLVVPFVFAAQKTTIVTGNLTCPECGTTFTPSKQPARWPLQEVCENCQANLRVDRF